MGVGLQPGRAEDSLSGQHTQGSVPQKSENESERLVFPGKEPNLLMET